MRYAHIIAAFTGQVWAMERTKLEAVAEFLAFKAGGGMRSDAELKALRAAKPADPGITRQGSIAVLPIVGSIMQRIEQVEESSGGVSADAIRAQIRALAADDQVRAIVLDLNTPGGSTAGVQALADEIWAARGAKLIVAQVNSLAASAGYWLASQANEIVVTPGGEAGSIGVFAVHADISGKLAAEGVKPTIVQAGANKTELANTGPLGEEARTALQARIDAAYGDFVGAVARGRDVSADLVLEKFGQGRVFHDRELVQRGMADRIATLDDTLARLGAAPPKLGAAHRSRAAFAAGDTPALSTLEHVLRDAGMPKALAAEFVSRGRGALRRSESGEAEPRDRDAAARFSEQVREMREQLAGVRLPKL